MKSFFYDFMVGVKNINSNPYSSYLASKSVGMGCRFVCNQETAIEFCFQISNSGNSAVSLQMKQLGVVS